MIEYKEKLKNLIANFSYYEFLDLLNEIDLSVIDGKIGDFDSEFIYYFNQIINMVNDNYLLDNNRPGSLGHMLVENALVEKKKITPTLAMCFFLEQKYNLDLEFTCNYIIFLENAKFNMAIDDADNGSLKINWSVYKNFKGDIDEYNYKIMKTLLHETTHVYQYTRNENTDNIFDKLVYYDYQQLKNLLCGMDYNGSGVLHQSFLSEFMADEQAEVYMLQIAKNHPEYFNEQLIKEKFQAYQYRKTGKYGNCFFDPRKAERKVIDDVDKGLEDLKNDKDYYIKFNGESFIAQLINVHESMLAKADEIDKKRLPLISYLQKYGISERGYDSYYNIFLKSLYKFNGEEIILSDEEHKKGIINSKLSN